MSEELTPEEALQELPGYREDARLEDLVKDLRDDVYGSIASADYTFTGNPEDGDQWDFEFTGESPVTFEASADPEVPSSIQIGDTISETIDNLISRFFIDNLGWDTGRAVRLNADVLRLFHFEAGEYTEATGSGTAPITVSNEEFTGGANGLHQQILSVIGSNVQGLNETIGAMNAISGTYIPTLTTVTNSQGLTAQPSQWMRIGNVITVSGQLGGSSTGAGSAAIGISLPVPSNLANEWELGGAAYCPSSAGLGAAIKGDSTNDRASMVWTAGGGVGGNWQFIFSYRVN